jgi:hypothetical protein
VTLTRPDRSVIQQQKTPVPTFGLTFYRTFLQTGGVPTPLSIQFFYTPTMERTFVELFDCSIGPDRFTGSSPVINGTNGICLYQTKDSDAPYLPGQDTWFLPVRLSFHKPRRCERDSESQLLGLRHSSYSSAVRTRMRYTDALSCFVHRRL